LWQLLQGGLQDGEAAWLQAELQQHAVAR
jgi:hypothetical protein